MINKLFSTLLIIVGLGLIASIQAYDRVVVCEEAYSEG